jgi:hypothetical protein
MSLAARVRFTQLASRALDPVVHRVEAHEHGLALHLLQHGELQGGLNISKKNERSIEIRFRELGLKIREYVQLSGERGALVHVLVVTPCPEKRFARRVFEAFEIDSSVASAQNRFFARSEIIAHDSHHAHWREVAGGQSEIARGAAKRLFHFAKRRLDSVERN